MKKIVRCAWCGSIYDAMAVTVVARYVDCSMWKAPCCGSLVDDRGETGWKSTQDYYVLGNGEEMLYDERGQAYYRLLYDSPYS